MSVSSQRLIRASTPGPRVKAVRKASLQPRRWSASVKLDKYVPPSVTPPRSTTREKRPETYRGLAARTTLSLESGPIGGVPVEGVGFAGAMNPEGVNSICDTFDLYDGGYLDMTCLAAAEIDRDGNVNVSKFGPRCPGPGGFINISQNTPKVCFMGAFTAGKSEITVEDGRLNILQDGPGVKFIDRVQQITFSAEYANKAGQTVLYITERAVFTLTPEGIMLTEIAPGVDLERDILAHMEFRPIISPELRQMDPRIFRQEKMGLRL